MILQMEQKIKFWNIGPCTFKTIQFYARFILIMVDVVKMLINNLNTVPIALAISMWYCSGQWMCMLKNRYWTTKTRWYPQLWYYLYLYLQSYTKYCQCCLLWISKDHDFGRTLTCSLFDLHQNQFLTTLCNELSCEINKVSEVEKPCCFEKMHVMLIHFTSRFCFCVLLLVINCIYCL